MARPESQQNSLSKEQVDELIKQGRVVVESNLVLEEKGILIKELLLGPFSGEGRHTAESDMIQDSPDHKSIERSVGTTEYVRGGLSLNDRAMMIKRIKSCSDRIGIDTIEQKEEPSNEVDYPTPQERETEIGTLLVYDFRHSFTGGSSNLRLEHTDFLTARRSLVVSTAANLDVRMRLSAEINKE